ncbi:unnamed protein product [Allacma fusca]|uniref:Uncharacterized protein n=1 Tax=Allacma fusca TaxID=39272 RepID=A0A8J2KC93_9HEXA|nr:unnamed protein product [Allacma fusca]
MNSTCFWSVAIVIWIFPVVGNLVTPETFPETFPKLQLKSFKLFSGNKTVTQNETHLILPKVFDELVFESNSTIPTRWKFFGPQLTDRGYQKIQVEKWHYSRKKRKQDVF